MYIKYVLKKKSTKENTYHELKGYINNSYIFEKILSEIRKDTIIGKIPMCIHRSSNTSMFLYCTNMSLGIYVP